jgi:hypothetical protein
MRERPILFSGPMVRAILDGQKTMTRRVVKQVPPASCTHLKWNEGPRAGSPRWIMDWGLSGCYSEEDESGTVRHWLDIQTAVDDNSHEEITCPYGTVGDRLWARESFRVSAERHPPDDHVWCTYIADGTRFEVDGSEIDMGRLKLGRSVPSIHMPRWASRITLEITGVRVERLHDITPNECRAEGSYWATDPDDEGGFVNLWNGINGKRGYGWDVNPWVWVIGFERKVT